MQYETCYGNNRGSAKFLIGNCYRKTTARLNKLLLGDLRTNRERVILPSSRSKIKKKYSFN